MQCVGGECNGPLNDSKIATHLSNNHAHRVTMSTVKNESQNNSLFQEEITACAAVHMCYIMDMCYGVQSIILLLNMVGMLFVLIVC